MTRQQKKQISRGLLGALISVLLVTAAGFVFTSCDAGDSPDPPTGPSELFDEPRPGVTARVSPSSVSVPDPVTSGTAVTGLKAWYRDADNNPQQGVQVNFRSEPARGGEQSNQISFDPDVAYTNGSGEVSTSVFVGESTPPGSYTLVAFTSPASAGPNAQGQTVLYVSSSNIGETIERPIVRAADTSIDLGEIMTFFIDGPSVTSENAPVCYTYQIVGLTQANLPQGTITFDWNFGVEGDFFVLVRGFKCADPSVVSDWSEPVTVSVAQPTTPTP